MHTYTHPSIHQSTKEYEVLSRRYGAKRLSIIVSILSGIRTELRSGMINAEPAADK